MVVLPKHAKDIFHQIHIKTLGNESKTFQMLLKDFPT